MPKLPTHNSRKLTPAWPGWGRLLSPFLLLLLLLLTAPCLGQELRGVWRLEGEEPLRGSYQGSARFQLLRPGEFTYKRTLVYARSGERKQDEGIGLLKDGLLRTRSRSLSGLEESLDFSSAVQGTPQGGGVYRFGPDFAQGVMYSRQGALQSERLYRPSPGADNSLRLLVDGTEAFPAFYEAIAAARRTICVQTFSWVDDETGRKLANLLIQKAKAGVRVRCLVESAPQFGGWGWDIEELLQEGGVEILLHHGWMESFYNQLTEDWRGNWDRLWHLMGGRRHVRLRREGRGLVNHDHRKIWACDGKIAFVGGMNIGDEYGLGTVHDVQVSIQGSAVAELEELFFERWHAAGGTGQADPDPEVLRPDYQPGVTPVDVHTTLPGLEHSIKVRYLQEIAQAEEEILIENPYVLYDEILDAMQDSAQREVRTVLIVPSEQHTDEPLVREAFRWVRNDLVRAGVELYEYPALSHGKVAVFDGECAVVGSANLDALSLEHNAEVALFVCEREFAGEMLRRVHYPDIERSQRVEVRTLSWWQKIKAGTFHFIRDFL